MHDDGHNLLSRTSPIHAMLLLLFGTTKAKIKAWFPGASAWPNGIPARFEPASHGGKRGGGAWRCVGQTSRMTRRRLIDD